MTKRLLAFLFWLSLVSSAFGQSMPGPGGGGGTGGGTGCISSGSSILKGDGAGGCVNASSPADYVNGSSTLGDFAATTSAQLAGVITNETGTGALVFGTSPTIVTPTIASFVNATHNHQDAASGGLLSGLVFSQFAASTSADLATLINDETGSGPLVFNISPVLVTPQIASFTNALHTHQDATGGGTLVEAALALTDITVNNATSARHGFLPKLSNNLADCLLGTGVFATCPGATAGSGDVSSNTSVAVDSEIAVFSGSGGKTIKRATGTGLAGITSGVLSSVNTSAGLAGFISDETGSGLLVFGTSPTIVTPTIASFANATHNHTNSAGGGQITDAALSAAVTVPKGGTGLTAGTSGGIPYFSGSTTIASSAALTANLPVIGGGAGVAPTVGSRSGNTTVFGTTSGSLTANKQVTFDASGNLIASASDVGAAESDPIVKAINGIVKSNTTTISAAVAGTDYEIPLSFNSPLSRSSGTISCATCAVTGTSLAQFASTTSLQLLTLLSDETGTGAAVFANTPTLVTPVLGVASATTINKVTITAPATSATLTIAQGATLSAPSSATVSGTNTGDQTITLTGDVTGTGTGSFAATIATAAVTNAKMANMATATFKGRTTAGTGVPEDLTVTQATAMLNNFVGDSGSGGTKGLVPAPAANDATAGKFLKADGTWTAPSGAGDVVGPASSVNQRIAIFSGTTGKLLADGGATIAGASVATAAALTTGRTINGVSFDGTANITVTAAAGTLSGATLASGVTASSLTSFGTSPTIVTPTIASFANAAHNHTNAAGGGQLTDAALSAAVGLAKGGTNQTTWTASRCVQVNAAGTQLESAAAACGSGGGGTPGGSTTQLQYNNASAFGGISGATSDGTNVTYGSTNLRATSPRITTGIQDANGNSMIAFSPTASAVDGFTVTNAATANPATVSLSATGSDSNINVALVPKGTGTVNWGDCSTNCATIDTSAVTGLKSFAIPNLAGTFAMSTNNLSVFASTTSAQLATLLSDETGSGIAVFQTSPTIITPTIASFTNSQHNHTNAAGGGQLLETALNLTDVTTANATTSAHGFLPKLSGVNTQCLVGDGTWASTCGTGGGGSTNADISSISVTTATNPSAEATLKNLTIPAGALNISNLKVDVHGSGRYTTAASQTPTLRFRVYLCTVSGCGSGTVLTLADFTTAATTAATTNSWMINGRIGTASTGASGTVESKWVLQTQLGAAGNLSPESRMDQNNAVSSAIDLTAQLFLRVTVLASTSNGSNSVSQRMGYISFMGSGAVVANNSITSTQLAVVNTRRACIFENDTQSATVLTDAQITGRACQVPANSTVVEVMVHASNGTPSVVLNRWRPSDASSAALLSGALATNATGLPACVFTATSTLCPITNITSSSSITLANTALTKGDLIQISSATAGGVATWHNVTIWYVIN